LKEVVEKSEPRDIPENVKEIARLIDERTRVGADIEALSAKRTALVVEITSIDSAVAEKRSRLDEINKSLRALAGV
jgi:uncharacterized coiled-coil DUF342 family protein